MANFFGIEIGSYAGNVPSIMKLSDYIAERLAEWGVRHVFLVTGGGAMHLNDSFGKELRLHYVCNHHEQACAMAAEAYARVTGHPGVINVTTGPGGINALNGVFGAWTDSIPMLIVSGQVKRETCMATAGTTGLRQLGDQEVDIVSMVKGITKYAVLVSDPSSIRYHLERAWHLAQSGRPGPCWLDIPSDVQSADIDEIALHRYDPAEDAPTWSLADAKEQCLEVLERIRDAKRPVVMVGTGVRLSGAIDLLGKLAERLRIPVVTAWTAHDCFPSNHPLNCGRPGTIGDRAGNFTVQNADLLLVIGCRLNIRQVSYNWKYFARNAYKIQVDIDPAELQKPTVRPDFPIVCDARHFLQELDLQLDRISYDASRHAEWITWCQERVGRYDLRRAYPEISNGLLNPYGFVRSLFEQLASDDVVVCGDGTACVATFQVATIRAGQRMFTNSGCASMGYDLPAAIGAAFARDGRRVICLGGDGSIHLNIQELQTVKQHNLNLKIFVINNGGYLSIRQTQNAYFGRLVGEGPQSGLSFPDYSALGEAYGLQVMRIDASDHQGAIARALALPGPVLCEVFVDPCQEFQPKLASRLLPNGRMVSSPLEDLAPFLDREELAENMLVPLVED
jgi:acetolactate synthase-1/2/3 large subunit